MYADDAHDFAPSPVCNSSTVPENLCSLSGAIAELSKLKCRAPSQDKLFVCPADTFYYRLNVTNGTMNYVPQGHYTQSNFDYSSYEFNGANQATNAKISLLGMKHSRHRAGRKLTTIKHPERTVLVADASAFVPFSWHQPPPSTINSQGFEMSLFNNSKNVVGFVDGHVSYVKIYSDSSTNFGGYYSFSFFYNPPAGYDYQWSGD